MTLDDLHAQIRRSREHNEQLVKLLREYGLSANVGEDSDVEERDVVDGKVAEGEVESTSTQGEQFTPGWDNILRWHKQRQRQENPTCVMTYMEGAGFTSDEGTTPAEKARRRKDRRLQSAAAPRQ